MLRVLPAQLPWMAWFPRTLHSIQPEASVNATCSNLYFTARLSQDVRTCLAANKVARFFSWVVKRATSLFNSFCSNVSKQVASFLLPPYLHYTFHKHVAGTRLRSRGKRQKTVSNRKNNINRSEPSGILGRGKEPPFPLPRLPLDSLHWPIFFFANADFSSFFPQCGAWSQAHIHANSEVQKPTDVCSFRCRQSS